MYLCTLMTVLACCHAKSVLARAEVQRRRQGQLRLHVAIEEVRHDRRGRYPRGPNDL